MNMCTCVICTYDSCCHTLFCACSPLLSPSPDVSCTNNEYSRKLGSFPPKEQTFVGDVYILNDGGDYQGTAGLALVSNGTDFLPICYQGEEHMHPSDVVTFYTLITHLRMYRNELASGLQLQRVLQ